MSSGYKLTYFNVAGLAESIRFLFSYGGIDFEDNRVTFEEWGNLKPTTPYGQMPLLEYKGKTVNQSLAIARYVAKQVKLAGNNDWEDLEIDAMVDNINDMRLKISASHYEKDETRKAALKETLIKETIPFFLQRFEKVVQENDGHFCLKRLTWADLHFVSLLKVINYLMSTNIIADYPNLLALEKKVLELDGIKQWIQKRPQTDL